MKPKRKRKLTFKDLDKAAKALKPAKSDGLYHFENTEGARKFIDLVNRFHASLN